MKEKDVADAECSLEEGIEGNGIVNVEDKMHRRGPPVNNNAAAAGAHVQRAGWFLNFDIVHSPSFAWT